MNIDSIKAQVTAISEVMDTLTDKISELKKRADEAENRLRYIVWYAANVYDDKPHQFWNQVRLAAEHVADTESAAVINAYYENGCPFRRERNEAREQRDGAREEAAIMRVEVVAGPGDVCYRLVDSTLSVWVGNGLSFADDDVVRVAIAPDNTTWVMTAAALSEATP